METLERRLEGAFTRLGLLEPFIAAVVSRLPRTVVKDNPRIRTAGTDGAQLWFDETWCQKLNTQELFGLVVHEALHCVLMHPWRRESRNPTLWNIANDGVINAYILARGYKLPAGGVHLSWVTEDMDSEVAYERLRKETQNAPKPQAQQSQGGGQGQGDDGSGGSGGGQGDDGDDDGDGRGPGHPKHGHGGFDGTGDLHDATTDATKADMEATIAVAAQMAKDCGHGSKLIDRILGKVGSPTVHWQDVLRSMMTEAAAADYTYMRFSRRFIGSGLYMPSMRSENLGGLAVGFDTSGSMGQKEADRIAAELHAIVSDLRPAFIEVIYCDDEVTSVQRFEADDDLVLKPKGGGGTAFAPVFEHVDSTGDHYCGLIYFTDMESYDLGRLREPAFPVIWADLSGNNRAKLPFGTRVPVPL